MTHNQLARLNQVITLLGELRAELYDGTPHHVVADPLAVPQGSDLEYGALYEITAIGQDSSAYHKVGERLRMAAEDNLSNGDVSRTGDYRDEAQALCWFALRGNGTWITGLRRVPE